MTALGITEYHSQLVTIKHCYEETVNPRSVLVNISINRHSCIRTESRNVLYHMLNNYNVVVVANKTEYIW